MTARALYKWFFITLFPLLWNCILSVPTFLILFFDIMGKILYGYFQQIIYMLGKVTKVITFLYYKFLLSRLFVIFFVMSTLNICLKFELINTHTHTHIYILKNVEIFSSYDISMLANPNSTWIVIWCSFSIVVF